MIIELRTSRGKITVLLVLSCVTALSAWLIVRPWAASFAIPSLPIDPELLRAWRSHPEHLQYQHQHLGKIRQYSVAFQDYEEARNQYRMALRENPLSSRTWFDIARTNWWLGRAQEAESALKLAMRFNPSEARLRWEAALFQIQLGSFDEAVANLAYLVRTDRNKRWSYFALVRTLATPTDLIESIIPSDREVLSDYLDYLISHQEADDVRAVWKKLARIVGPAIDPILALSYTNFMLAQKEMPEAEAAWSMALKGKGIGDRNTPDNLVWNSGFERDETLGMGFDWRLRSIVGADVGIDAYHSKEGKRSLKISFDGTHNVDLSGIRQVVRVRPDARYLLGGHIKTYGITTSTGLRLEAVDLFDGRLYGATEELVGDHDWSEVKTSFLTSPRAQAIVVRIRRAPSQKLDNLIAGTAWVDQVYLREIH